MYYAALKSVKSNIWVLSQAILLLAFLKIIYLFFTVYGSHFLGFFPRVLHLFVKNLIFEIIDCSNSG